MKNLKKILMTSIFVLCLIAGITISAKAEDNTYDIKTGIYSEYYSDISQYREKDSDDNYVTPTGESGYVFAGWYSDKKCGDEAVLSEEDIAAAMVEAGENDSTVSAYAKFVSIKVLSAAVQIKADTDSTTSTTTMRFVTTVDSLNYREVGFVLVRAEGTENEKTYTGRSNVVYRKLYAVGTDGTVTENKPTDFHEASEFFMAVNLNNIPASYFETGFTATPYWITCDGTRVDGASSVKTVMVGIPLVCEAKVTGTTGIVYYYTTLEKAFTVMSSDNVYLNTDFTVEVIQDVVKLESTLTVYDSVTLTNETGRDVTIKRRSTEDEDGNVTSTMNSQFIDNYASNLTVEGVTIVSDNESKGSLTFDGEEITNNYGCIDSDSDSSTGLTLKNISIVNILANRTGGAVRTTGNVTIEGCTFTNNVINETSSGAATNGGAIYYNGSDSEALAINNSTFTSNQSTSGVGGAIYVYAGTVAIDGSSLVSNSVTGESANGGGCIYVRAGSVTLIDTELVSNNTTTKGGAIYAHSGTVNVQEGCKFSENSATIGGAIFANKATVNIKGSSSFEKNTATESGGALYVGNTDMEPTVSVQDSCTFTGNEAVSGGAIYVQTGTLTTTSSTFSTNQTPDGNGGAICISGGTVTDTSSTFSGNSAKQGGAIRVDGGTVTFNSTAFTKNTTANNGGAINAQEPVTLNVCTFTENVADGNGGAILVNAYITEGGSTFTDNSANLGGAVYINSGTLGATSSKFESNEATHGGAIYVKGGILQDSTCSFTSNIANGNGGAITVAEGGALDSYGSTFTSNTGNHGGAVRVDHGVDTAEIESATFTSNATAETGSAYNGGAINAQDDVTVTNCSFSENRASYGNGGAIYIILGTLASGEESEKTSVTLKESGSTYTSNSAKNGGAICATTGSNVDIDDSIFTTNGGNHGAAIRLDSEVVSATITGATFTNNDTLTTAAYNGGAINAQAAVTVEECEFTGNNANNNGGAILAQAGLTITGCNFDGNGAVTNGGAVYANAGITENGSTFNKNSAKQGGAIYLYDGVGSISGGSQFTSNEATTGGGAIYIRKASDAVIDGVGFSSNIATTSGGAIYANAGTTTIQNSCTFSENSATNGGAVYVVKGTFTVQNSCSFTSNEATTGGAIYVAAGTFSTNSCSFTTNATDNGNGGAICIATGTWTDNSSNFEGNSAKQGGAIRIDSGITSVGLTNTTFKGNETANNGGAINAQGTVTLNTCTFTGNVATKNGGAILANANVIDNSSTYSQNSGVLGGAVHINNKTFEAISSEFTNNTATDGGAVYVTAGTLNISGSTMQENAASSGNGGAIYMADGTVNIKESSKFIGNTASAANGGAIGVAVGSLKISDSIFDENSARHGGAIRLDSTVTSLEIIDSVFTGNKTTAGSGGAINIQDTENPITIQDVIFTSNYAVKSGGSIYTKASGEMTVDMCTFDSNSVGSTGGAAQNDLGTNIKFTNTTIIKQDVAGFKNIDGVVSPYDCDDSYKMSLLNDVTEAEFEAYSKNFISAGYELQAQNEMNESDDNKNLFRTYYNSETGYMLHTYWVEYSSEVRTIVATVDESAFTPFASAVETTAVCTPLFHQLKALDSDGTDGGMGYIIRLTDGRFIIIDGGYDSTLAGNAYDIMVFLANNAPDSGNIVIASWFITHAHSDHSGAFKYFAENSSSLKTAASIGTGKSIGNITVESIMFNACDTTEQMTYCTSTKTDIETTISTYYSDAQVYKPLTGQVYTFADTSIEILHTMSDFLPNTIAYESDGNGGDYNVQSVVSIIDIDNTSDQNDRFFIMADTTATACDEMSRRYGDYMKCDYVQVAHHGLNEITGATNNRRHNATQEIYEHILKTDADGNVTTRALWTTSVAKFEERTLETVPINYWLVYTKKVKENIIAGNGAYTIEFE